PGTMLAGMGPALRTVVSVLAACALVCIGLSIPAAASAPGWAGVPGETSTLPRWHWPATPGRVTAAFIAPAHRYGQGHRGSYLAPAASAEVSAGAAGVVEFAGDVADRGIVTDAHGNGLVSTLEPVSPVVNAGELVALGEVVGIASSGGHSALGAVHLGARLHGEYINPMLLLAGIPRAVLLPCCSAASATAPSPPIGFDQPGGARGVAGRLLSTLLGRVDQEVSFLGG
ncbi:peptidoglycan DD-metalloendopeptidase family protein, partial [Mycobacterium sp.]|uniref:peptidoglycan DD-metalloendopeptidase family protein n=1 Tax=Mycobacterium sp. TaxID=1785 RepID=UPI003A8A462F